MASQRVLVTGGAGFIGSSVALAVAARRPDCSVVACDNLFRRGSELNLPRLRDAGVEFIHADVRHEADLLRLGAIDALVECSAEPSVLAATQGAARFVMDTNLVGAFNCLELAARHRAQVIFLSTSRVYPVAALDRMAFVEEATRFSLAAAQPMPGAGPEGISEAFPLDGARTLYGATKLGAELLVMEYAESYGLATTINRCGVVAGPWQMGKVDQGVFTHWLLSFYLGRPLRYIGYGGTGKQVRDLLHVDDLCELVIHQLGDPDGWAGGCYNVGGGRDGSLSLLETTELCRELTGNDVPVQGSVEQRPGDVRIYVSDCRALFARTAWRPRRSPKDVLTDTLAWISDNEGLVVGALG